MKMINSTAIPDGKATGDPLRKKFANLGRYLQSAAANGQATADIARNLFADAWELLRETTCSQGQRQFTVRELRKAFPKLNPPVIDGLLRQGETANIIGSSKAQKRWFVTALGLAVATGRPFLNRFATTQGKVLLVDNELHGGTLAHRIPVVANALAIPDEWYEDAFEVRPLRGRLQSIDRLDIELSDIQPNEFSLIALDSKYRFAVPGTSENDNSAEAAFYNTIDQIAERTKAAIALVHHGSKGNQSEKKVTDVGAGAGLMSRAADTHLVLREHETQGFVVLDAALRSFPPIDPVVLQWQFPIFVPTAGLDASKLRGKHPNSERQKERDEQGMNEITAALKGQAPMTVRELRPKVDMGNDRVERLLGRMERDGKVKANPIQKRGNKCYVYSLCERLSD